MKRSSDSGSKPEFRRAARLVVVDLRNRVLLFQYARLTGEKFWATPGGGLEDGERPLRKPPHAKLLRSSGLEILVSTCSVIGPLISYWSIGKSTGLRCFSFFVWNLGNSTRKFERCIAVRVFFRHAGGLWLSSRKVVNRSFQRISHRS
jgi:hypothetical protein